MNVIILMKILGKINYLDEMLSVYDSWMSDGYIGAIIRKVIERAYYSYFEILLKVNNN